MRMIDADELKTQLYESIMVNEDMDCLDFLRVESLIDAQPTAYDVDQVVEELKQRSKEYNSGVRLHGKPEEINTMSKEFDSGLLKRIADYFSSVYEGDDKTAPKMELSVEDLRYIASLNVEKCRLQTEINNLKKSHEEYNNGWIPCSEMMPRYEEDVLLYLNSYEVQMGYRAIQTGGDCFYIYMSCDFVDCEDVIAWQPLPEPYQPKG